MIVQKIELCATLIEEWTPFPLPVKRARGRSAKIPQVREVVAGDRE